jgi:magnesium-transporting ATPase (P-type)
VLLAVILAVGAPQDALFGIVLVANALIGIAQELRAKVTLDRLAVLSAPRVRVIRDGAPKDIAVAELVTGDLVSLRSGDQLVADGVVRASETLQADESLLTGESEPVDKRAGDQLLSGSFVVAGSGGYQATSVGADSYARKLAAEARQFALVRSELMDGINRILRYITWAIPPVAALLLVSQAHARASLSAALTGTVAALVGMVPQGLVLLTSVAFGVSAVLLARRRVLVISGDSPRAVGAVAARAGLPGASDPVDARHLPDDPDALGPLVEQHSVFGRVSPRQKQAMVKALQSRGHVVAMTGDGVNDVLALKLADIGIAMGSGAPATRAVAELVLLDGEFATLPGVVAEGRRVTANIERVANLFVTKTVWVTLLAVAVGVLLLPYPFLPRHLTIVDSLAIGVPSFFLALAPNQRRYRPGFVGRVLRFAIPAGAIIAGATFAAYALARVHGLPLAQQRTAATLVALVLSLCVLVLLAIPLTWRRVLLIVAMVAAFVLLFPLPLVRRFYELDLPHGHMTITLLVAAVGAAALTAFGLMFRGRGRGLARRGEQ